MSTIKAQTRRARRRTTASVTIRDVASRAGVSVATVSRVLNGKELVREDTSRQVLAAAKSMRYVPNVAARSLSIRRSHTIGIVLPEVHGEFFSEVIRGLDLAARREGYHILVSGSHSSPDEIVDMAGTMRGRVDGLVIMAPDIALGSIGERLAPNLPLVLLNSADDRHDAISVDNYGGARAMTGHLAALGHAEIAFIRGPEENADARERLRGYRQVMRTLGATPVEIEGDFTEGAGYAAVRQLIEGGRVPTAIFAANDSMAIGALSALGEQGLEVPQQVSVVGFDDIPIAHFMSPPLTTIRADIAGMGERAFALLCDSLGGSTRRLRVHERIATELVVRKSSAVPRKVRTSARPRKAARGQRQGE